MFWIMTAAMVVLVAAAIMRTLFSYGNAVAEPPAAYDLRVYRDQLREVDRDLARKVLSSDEAGRLRTEIGRKILDADRALSRQRTPQGRAPRPLIAGLVLLALIVASGALYTRIGSPGLPDLPLKQRVATANDRLENRPAQAEAEAAAPKRAKPEPDAEYLKLIEQLRAAVAKRPDDPQGLALLSEHEARLGNLVASREAQAKLISALGEKATANDHARLAGIMIESAGGTVSREAVGQLDAALKLDPENGQAQYLKGLMLAQSDRPDLAFSIWRGLLENSRPDAPWLEPIRQFMPDLAWLAGQPDYKMPEASGPMSSMPGMPTLPPMPGSSANAAMPGPDAAAIEAAGDMTPEQRQQMITGMVRQLEARLTEQGGSPEEWARLITSLVRLGDTAHARNVLAEAKKRFAGTPATLTTITDAAKSVGLTDDTPPAAPSAPTSAPGSAPAAAPAGTP